TENQVAGVDNAAPYGMVEIDASVTKDGQIAAIHDARLTRLTGGASTAYVNQLTYAEILALPYLFGDHIQLTTELIGRAAALDVPIMVTINKWGRINTAGFGAKTLDTLYAAAQAHPHPEWVYFGGAVAQDEMRLRHPDASTFWRYPKAWSAAKIQQNVAAEGVDLAALPRYHWKPATVAGVRTAGADVATRQITTADAARAAQAAGIDLIQGDDPFVIATQWCR
ncbi:MAG TPA: glycerophosphodiester phosphodiesterase family protein, partial [Micromonosporaceae bacterium]|nr:glycerophosphodiester phosphodiesterase family protein [Micromonosporaceae bacterium]